MYKKALENILKVPISFLYAFISTIVFSVLIFILSSYKQVLAIINIEQDFLSVITSVYDYLVIFLNSISMALIVFFLLYIIVSFVFFLTFWSILVLKKKINTNHQKEIQTQRNFLGVLSSIFYILGFGCAGCGQVLIFSILSVFISGLTFSTVENISFIFMFVATVLLLFSIHKNVKILSNPYVCSI